MTAAAEDVTSLPPASRQDRRSPRRWLIAALTAASIACGSACTANAADVPAVDIPAVDIPAVDVGGTIQPGLINTDFSEVPTAAEQAIRDTIDAMNSATTAGVTGQQEVLADLVEPTLADALNDCPPATTTLHFEPIYSGLRAAPGWTDSSGSLTGTVYALPTLIRIYTGDRITGTDLTTLHLGVQASEAYLTPLCVG